MNSTFYNAYLFLLNKIIDDNKNLLKTLNDVKRDVELPQNRQNITDLRTTGHLKLLMTCIMLPHKVVVGVTFDILASCTMDKEFTRELIDEYAFIPLLDDLLTRHRNERNVEERIIQILGNICHHKQSTWVNSILDKSLKFVAHTLELLKYDRTSSFSEATLLMALRFFRLLIAGSQYSSPKPLLHAFSVLKVIGSFFVKVTLETDHNENILRKVIELIHAYSAYTFHETINETQSGESIMYLCRRMRFFSERIPTIMASVVKQDQAASRPLLPDVSDWIIQNIMELYIEDSKDQYVSYSCCLCFMLLDTCENRHKQFLPLLIKVLRFIKDPTYADMECFILIIMTLNKYCVEDASLARDLLDCGIVEAFAAILMWVSGAKTLTLDFRHERAQKTCWTSFARRRNQLGSCNHPNPTFKAEYSWVTRSTLSHYSSLASSLSSGSGASGAAKDMAICACSDDINIDIMKNILLVEIVNMLESYMRFQPSMPEIVSEDLIVALLNCSVYLGQSFMFKDFSSYIACNLVKSPVHMLQLMRTPVIEKIGDMMRNRHFLSCAVCKKISDLSCLISQHFRETAASEAAKEMIKQGLMTDTDIRKAQLVLTVPYIELSNALLALFMLDCGGLGILLQLLKGDSPHEKRAIECVYVLATRRLEIELDTQNSSSVQPGPSQATKPAPFKTTRKLGRFNKIKNTKNKKKRTKLRLVAFCLDDGSTIWADRNKLTERSEYFSAMLDGRFKEGDEEMVALHDIPYDSLSFMLHLLMHPESTDQLIEACDLGFLLDAIVFSDRHLMGDVCNSMLSHVLQHRMTSKTVAAIYEWSVKSKLNLLWREAVTFALVSCTEEDARIAMFEDLLAVGCTEDLIEDMRTIFEENLKTCL